MTSIVFCLQVCCGLCIYRRQFGLQICCGKDDDDDGVTSATRRGLRKSHIVLAAQFNRAFDNSIPAVDRHPTATEDQSPTAAAKEDDLFTAAECSTPEQDAGEESVPLPASEHADEETDATVAGTNDEMLADVTIGRQSPDVAADDVDKDVDQTLISVADDGIASVVEPTNGENEQVEDTISVGSSASRSSKGKRKSWSSETQKESVESPAPFSVPDDITAVVPDELTDKTLKPEVVLMQVTLPETESDRHRKKTLTPTLRRWKSMGAGLRLPRVTNAPTCDKAVDVCEDDLVAQPEQETVIENETDALMEEGMNEEHRPQDEDELDDTVKELDDKEQHKTESTTEADESTLREPQMMGNLVLDLDELGILTAQDVKHEEVGHCVFWIWIN